jgi:hypothetical protein
MEATAAVANANPTNDNFKSAITAGLRAEKADQVARESATRAGYDYDAEVNRQFNAFRDAEYNAAVQQLNELNPNAPQQTPADFASVTENADGTLQVRLATGETFKGDARKIIDSMGKSYVFGKRWAQSLKSENQRLKSGQASPENNQPPQPDPNQPADASQPGWDSLGQLPDQGSRFLVENAAKVLGYSNANELINHQLERDRKLEAVERRLEGYETERLSMEFQSRCPDFPGTQQAADAVVGIIEQSGLDYTPDNLALAHQHALRSGMYQALRPDEIQASYSPQRHDQSRRVPPPPPAGSAPTSDEGGNPWATATDDLRRRVLSQGGLGKALLDLKPGETFGG